MKLNQKQILNAFIYIITSQSPPSEHWRFEKYGKSRLLSLGKGEHTLHLQNED